MAVIPKEQSTCLPVKNVMFLKTHKTASSTMLNILYRFTEKYNLSIALPAGGSWGFKYPKPFMSSSVNRFLKNAEGSRFNIICNHMKFNLPEVRKVMPNNTFYVSIVRYPISQLESSYAYFRNVESFMETTSLDEFLLSPQRLYNPNSKNHMLARNSMWYDFGYDSNAEDTGTYVRSVLSTLDQTFHLVLNADYFDESMVLLKNILCWEMEDVVYFKMNSRSKDTVQHITESSKLRVKEWCSLDWKLYQHFNRTFWRTVHETIGLAKLREEVKILQDKQKELMVRCLQEGHLVDKTQIKDSNLQPVQSGQANILGFNLRQGLEGEQLKICYRMVVPEHIHSAHMRAYQHNLES